MTRHQLRAIISDGESATVEFKRKFTSAEKIAKEVIAFANTKGGYLIVGVDDNKRIVGVESEKEQVDLVLTACRFSIDPPIEPEVEIIQIDYVDVVVFSVRESELKPHVLVTQGDKPSERRAYLRDGAAAVAASKEMERVMRRTRPDAPPVTLSIGKNEKMLFEFLHHHTRITVKQFAHLVNISERRASKLLIRLVQVGILAIHSHESSDYFTLMP